MKHSWGDEAAAEIERLEHMQANLHGHIKRLEDENAHLSQKIQSDGWVKPKLIELKAENAKLREALVKTRAAINDSAADTLWVGDIETAVDCIDAALQKDESPLLKWKGAFTFAQKDEGDAAHACHAGRDGECTWKHCPQERDGEPARTGRHCPLDIDEDEGE